MTLEVETIRLVVLFVSFFGVALWETFRPRRRLTESASRRWGMVFVLFLLSIAVVAAVAPERSGGALAPAWLSAFAPSGWAAQLAIGATLFVLLDLLYYAYHRVLHVVPLLWRVHAVHHSD